MTNYIMHIIYTVVDIDKLPKLTKNYLRRTIDHTIIKFKRSQQNIQKIKILRYYLGYKFINMPLRHRPEFVKMSIGVVGVLATDRLQRL